MDGWKGNIPEQTPEPTTLILCTTRNRENAVLTEYTESCAYWWADSLDDVYYYTTILKIPPFLLCGNRCLAWLVCLSSP